MTPDEMETVPVACDMPANVSAMLVDLEAVNSMPLPEAAIWYVRHRFVITACRTKDKNAYLPAWNKPDGKGWFDTVEKVKRHWQTHPNDNIGIILRPSGVITFDIDDEEITQKVFTAAGLDSIVSTPAVRNQSGHKNHAKMVFTAPEGVILTRKVLNARIGGRDTTIFELRAGKPAIDDKRASEFYDVAPPSIHPDMGMAYQWIGKHLTPAPPALIDLWMNFDTWLPTLRAYAEGREPLAEKHLEDQEADAVAPRRKKTTNYDHDISDVANAWNAKHDLVTELLHYGYRRTDNPMRVDRPDCKESDKGVLLLSPFKFKVFNASDEFCDGNPHDAWDLYVRYEHDGSKREAVKAAEVELGMTPAGAVISEADRKKYLAAIVAGMDAKGFAYPNSWRSEAGLPPAEEQKKPQAVTPNTSTGLQAEQKNTSAEQQKVDVNNPDYLRQLGDAAFKHVIPQFPPVGEEEDEPDDPKDTYDYDAEDAALKTLMDRAPIPLKAAVNYYNAISPIPQPLFALAASLVAASAVLARNWQTVQLRFDTVPMPPNTLNDYNIFIAPTGCGKDTIKNFLADAIDNEYIRQPSGASGRTAIHKTLQATPRTIMFWDEAGKRLAERGRDPSGIKQEAETLAMEIYGRTGYVEPQEYADTKDSPILKRIKRHGLVVVRTTTPETFAAAVPQEAVKDGWLPRHNVVISYRPRPASVGEYNPNAAVSNQKKVLKVWNAWKDAHIGMPEADTYRQAVSPITACGWKYSMPEDVGKAAEQMRERSGRYNTALPVTDDEPIGIGWDNDAAEEIARIYAENEAVPADNYTCMRHRKVAHIIKIAGIIAVLRDKVTREDMERIRQKYTESEKGSKLLEEEHGTLAELQLAEEEYEYAQKDAQKTNGTDEKREKRLKEAKTKLDEANRNFIIASSNAESGVHIPIRKEARAKLTPRIKVNDVRWASDYINLIEAPVIKLVEEELVDIGFIAAMDGLIAYLAKRPNQSATESKISHQCTAIKRLDEKHLLKQFWDYAQDTELVEFKSSNRGRRWYLISTPPTQKKGSKQKNRATPPQTETGNITDKEREAPINRLNPFQWAQQKTADAPTNPPSDTTPKNTQAADEMIPTHPQQPEQGKAERPTEPVDTQEPPQDTEEVTEMNSIPAPLEPPEGVDDDAWEGAV